MAAEPDHESIGYLVFDIESVADPGLISLVRTQGKKSPGEALREFRDELTAKNGSDFIPYTFQVPISLALAKLREDFSLKDLIVLRVEDGGPREICKRFWSGWQFYGFPQLVSFNGRKFDVPLLELTAFRYGITVPRWFTDYEGGKQLRSRYANSHLDLFDALTNYGVSNFFGGLNLASKLLRKPGKIDVKGEMVQDMFEDNRLEEIHRYCRCDVLDTYFVFLRYQQIRGAISPQKESDLIAQTRVFLETRAEEEPVYREYLNVWQETNEYLNSNDIFAAYEK